MNNSKFLVDNVSLDLDKVVDTAPHLRQRQAELTEIIEALDTISQSAYWIRLKEKVFDGIHEALQRKLAREKDTSEMFRLQGQIYWVEKYADLSKMSETFRNEPKNITSKL